MWRMRCCLLRASVMSQTAVFLQIVLLSWSQLPLIPITTSFPPDGSIFKFDEQLLFWNTETRLKNWFHTNEKFLCSCETECVFIHRSPAGSDWKWQTQALERWVTALTGLAALCLEMTVFVEKCEQSCNRDYDQPRSTLGASAFCCNFLRASSDNHKSPNCPRTNCGVSQASVLGFHWVPSVSFSNRDWSVWCSSWQRWVTSARSHRFCLHLVLTCVLSGVITSVQLQEHLLTPSVNR